MTLDVHLFDKVTLDTHEVTLDTLKVTRQPPYDCDDTVVCVSCWIVC